MPATSGSTTIGAKLRHAREGRGVSLRQIADATKISVGFLEALERNDISRLPGGIFTRAFVRSYAIEVGLDPDETIRDFMAQFPQDSVTAGHPESRRIEEDETFESDRRAASVFVKLMAISLPLAFAVLYLGNVRRTGLRPPAPPPQQTASAPAADVALAPDAETPLTARLAVGITAREKCSVSITVDGTLALDRQLDAGESRSYDVGTELVLTTSNASAVALTLNGTDARPLGDQGQNVTARINLGNFKTYLPAQ